MMTIRFSGMTIARHAQPLLRWCGAAALALVAGLGANSALAQSGSSFGGLTAAAHEVRTEQVEARLLAHAPEGVQAGKPLWLGLQLTHAPHWHTYWKNPGDSGQATSLRWTLPADVQAGDIAWPAPSKLPVGPLANYGYDGTVLLPVAVTLPEAGAPAGPIKVELEANWLACKQECIPQQGKFTFELPAGQPLTADAVAFDAALQAVPQALPGGNAVLRASVDAQRKHIVFSSEALPEGWQGKMLNLYPETPEIITPAAAGEQRWDGKRWQIELPLHDMRMESPDHLPVVLALRGEVDADGVVRNAAGPAYRTEAAVAGTWPAAQSPAEMSPELAAALRANAQTTKTAPPNGTAGMTFWLALGGALLGGLLLNLMPCVFPVLAIKVMSFARHAHSPREQRVSGLAYTAGVVLSFAALAGLLLVLRAAGEQLGWGFQLQNPWLVAALAGLFTVLGLNLAGVFHVGQLLPGRVAQATARHPVSDALLSGVLAVLVASPCTAPFMGASLGYAIQLPALQALLLFMAMGVGLALPILLGSFFPGILRWLPQPGAWMDTFKQLMAFPMFATVVWLLWVLGHQSGVDGAMALLALLLTGSALLWALGRSGKARVVLAGMFGALLLWLAAGYGGLIESSPPVDSAAATNTNAQPGALWQPWSEQRVQQALAAGQPVFVDYTAAWCVTCQFNKKTVLSTEDFLTAMRARNVLLLRADWTRSDPAITASLNALGRNGVPMYALHDPKAPAQPQVLTEVLTLNAVQEALSSLK